MNVVSVVKATKTPIIKYHNSFEPHFTAYIAYYGKWDTL